MLAWYCGMPEKTPALRGHGKKAGCLLTSPLFATVSLSLVVVIFGEQNLRIFVLGWVIPLLQFSFEGHGLDHDGAHACSYICSNPPCSSLSTEKSLTALWSACMLSHYSRVQLFASLWTVARQAPLSVEFSRPEHWSGLPFPSPGDPPNSGVEPTSSAMPADSLPLVLPGESHDPWDDPPILPASVELEVSMTRGLSPCILSEFSICPISSVLWQIVGSLICNKLIINSSRLKSRTYYI